MKKKKHAVEAFVSRIKHFYDMGGIKVRVLWKEKALLCGQMCFGVYMPHGRDGNSERKEIWVAGDWPKKIVIALLAHEFAHAWRDINGFVKKWDESEEEKAEQKAKRMIEKYADSKQTRSRTARNGKASPPFRAFKAHWKQKGCHMD